MTTAALVIGMVGAGGAANASPAPQQATTAAATASAAAVEGAIVKTADLSKFQPGNIISDAAFSNSGAMSEAQIQAFLQARVPNCQSGYVCLKDWYDTSRTTAADAMCGAYSGGVRERASTIIYKVAQACGINPQVLLVMLQKEQGLVTHTWPSDWRYTIAMGQGCPDTAACDTRYYGFFNQMYGAAWQLKRYANPPGTSQYFTWFAPGKTWNVRWHPNESCGSAPVYIQNQATANLYYYTPYQPNAAAIRAGYGEGDGCSAYGNRNFYQYFTDWFGSTQEDPLIGSLELSEALPGEFRVAGWAAKAGNTASLDVHVYVGSVGTAATASLPRSDVGAAYPAVGSAHGFDVRVPATGEGTFDVCVYAINLNGGAPATLGCSSLTAKSGSPAGQLESVTPVDGAVEVKGWAVDPDTAKPASVHVYVDSAGTALLADAALAQPVAQFPGYGTAHGFTGKLTASPGAHSVCAYAINSGPGANVLIGCKDVIVPGAADLGRAPFGRFDSVTVSGSTAVASGWAIDPDTSASVDIHLYVGSAGKAIVADKSRPDVESAYPGFGASHGFAEQLSLPSGQSDVCAYAINTGAGGNTFLGCKTVTAASAAAVDRGQVPFGNLEAVEPAAGGASVSGWALDPDTSDPIAVHIYADSVGYAFLADGSRTDVGAAYPGKGDRHGYSQFVSMASGSHSVCVYAINNGAGGHALIACRDIVVP
ncbi:MAG: hypothetical protein ABWY26_12970 [Microbacterium sp.]